MTDRYNGRVIRVAGELFLIPSGFEYMGLDSEGIPLVSDRAGLMDAPLLHDKNPEGYP